MKIKRKRYAGAGNRNAPQPYVDLSTDIARIMDAHGWLLNVGGAEGIDTGFMNGTENGKLFLPWDGFNNLSIQYKIPKKAYDLAIEFHEMGERLELHRGLYSLHARNAMVVLDEKLDNPVDLLIVYTRDGVTKAADVRPGNDHTGGTGTAIKIAEAYDVPVVNLKNRDSLELLSLWTGIDFTELVSLPN